MARPVCIATGFSDAINVMSRCEEHSGSASLSALILAGGESRRMGRDKAWLEANGQPLIRGAIATARELGSQEVFISGRAGKDYSSLGCPVLLDRHTGSGPLAGIERGLEACGSPLLLVLAVDLPGMNVAFLRKLLDLCGSSTGVVPMLSGHFEPLAAIYPKASHAVVMECLNQSRYAASAFARECIHHNLVTTYQVGPEEAGFFANWNSVADVREM
ncbi:MAG: molybdenum cofactor guanylyltransferase [Limisphaerales bacterium]